MSKDFKVCCPHCEGEIVGSVYKYYPIEATQDTCPHCNQTYWLNFNVRVSPSKRKRRSK